MIKIRLILVRALCMIPMAFGVLNARVGLSALFTSIAGRYGGGVFRNWKGLNVLAILPDSVHNPNTAKQARARSTLTCVSKAWGILSVIIKAQWSTVAEYLSGQWGNFENEVGSHVVITTPRGPYTPLGAMVATHGLLASVDEWECGDAIAAAPVGVTPSSQCTGVNVTGNTAGMVVTWTDPATWGANAHPGNCRVWAKSENGRFFAQISGFVAAAAETFTITALVPAGGEHPVPLIPGLYFIQLDAINAEGMRSAPSNIFKIVIAAPPLLKGKK